MTSSFVVHEAYCGCVAKVDPKTRHIAKVYRACKGLEKEIEKNRKGAVARHLRRELKRMRTV